MIYTVTFNPSLDYIVSVDDFKLGLTNRTSSELMLPGGKGINVSIVLKNLGIESTALGFMAGFTGKEIARRLEEDGVTSDFIQIEEGISRLNDRLKNIIYNRYYENKTQMEIAEELGISQAQVSRLEKNALKIIFNQ